MRKWNDLPLRVRLTLLYVGLFSALLLMLATVFYLDTRHFLISNLASRLSAQTESAVEQWQRSPAPPPAPPHAPAPPPPPGEQGGIPDADSLAESIASKGSSVLILDAQGRVVASDGENANQLPKDSRCFSKALSSGQEVTCITKVRGKRYLELESPLRRAPDGPVVGVAQVTASLHPVDKVLARQQLALGIGFGLLLLLGAALGLWITSSALKPLDDMVETCNRIAEGDLSQRVHLPQRKDEIGRLAEAFDRMADRVEATFEAQGRFIASAAHELRTPLAALQGSMEVLLRGALDDPSTAHRLTQSMYREVTRLFRLCDQLLDLSRVRAAEPIHRRSLDLGKFFGEFVAQARFLAQERNLSLVPGPSITIPADPDALKRVLFNLVDNSVQHTAEGGHIVVGWNSVPGGVEIFVEDDGEGIPPKDLPHVFEPFYRGDSSRSRRRGGTGLGLALSKALVEAHGGRISVSSEPGKATRFTIFLPDT